MEKLKLPRGRDMVRVTQAEKELVRRGLPYAPLSSETPKDRTKEETWTDRCHRRMGPHPI